MSLSTTQRRPIPAVFLGVFLLAGHTPVRSAEPWADAKLSVRDGLELWLDAARAHGDTVARFDGKLAEWRDASGKGRHVRQPVADARPVRLPAGAAAVVRFDGLDDHLRAVGQATDLDAFTVFVVAAPRRNPGAFAGLLAFNAINQRDYTSGLNIDLGPTGTPRFSALNVEGRGFGGQRNLRTGNGPFGRLYAVEVASDGKAVRVTVDGKAEGERPRAGGPVRMDEITVGARFYTNGPGPQQVAGFTRCDLAEVLVYDRTLSADESKRVRDYLAAKYAGASDALPPDAADNTLVPVADPPPVQVFVPGFTVRELPVALTNVNTVKYRPDGTLVALGYDGTVRLLRDTDGDGLEDTAVPFWENTAGVVRGPIGMELTPPGYAHGDGVFVPSKGRLTLLLDTDKDDKADKEVVIGTWPEIKQSVDTLGVAVDPKDGAVFYGRGCFDYTNGYRRDKAGKSDYKLSDETGTVIRLAPDLKSRAIVATGIRFPVALRFNRHGDLFCTDQEGATWLPNGNPLDELLHVQKGRHYGFPPRHPAHLPNVIDEPSTFDYGPQHQSVCGLNFNEPVKAGGPAFGPPAWAGDAIVTGYSRGKLYRTTLVKSAAGYVGRTHLFACLNALTVDACVTPDGGLLVATHGGGPDWGSGPTGKGKLYKVTFADRDHPQPVLAWPAGPREVRVEFDRPVDPSMLRDVLRQTKLTAGEHVRAGDRYESVWPGYAVVQTEKATPRYDVPVRSAQLTPDRRTLVLATDPLPAAVHYALTLPGMGRPPLAKANPQHPAIDLDFDLSGCEATWTPTDGTPAWTGWLPHLDLQVAREMTAGSAPHDALWAAMTKPGELVLKTQLNLTDMLRPAVQPGSRIDYEWPAEEVTVAFEASGATKVTAPTVAGGIEFGGSHHRASGTLTDRPKPGRVAPVEFRITSPLLRAPTFTVSYSTNEDKRQRPFQLHRILVPWADTNAKALDAPVVAARAPELADGNWARGRAEFFGEQAACGKCHAIHGRGGDIGPDLSNLAHRDYPSVYRDIERPSFAINPDHLTYAVNLKDGRTLTGVVRSAGDRLRIGDAKGVLTEVSRADVESMTAAAVSTMPDGLPKLLGPDRTRDLMTYLLAAPPRMPDYGPNTPPEPRSRKEVADILAGAPSPPAATRAMTVVLVAGRKDHGPGEHDYPAWRAAWKDLFAIADKTTVETADDWPTPAQLKAADVFVFYQQGKWTPDRAKDMDAFLARGGGAVYVHYAVDGGADAPGFAQRIGLAWKGGASKFRHGPLDLGFEAGAKHPVARNFGTVRFHDESYWQLVGDPKRVTLLATGKEDGKDQPLFWSLEPAKGRVFVSIPGHFSWTFDDPLFRVLLLRGIAWAAKEPVDRFNDLVTPGARMKD